DRQRNGERKNDPRQPRRELHQHVRGLRAKNVLRDAGAKGRAKTFTLWSLHQDDKHHQRGDYHEEHQAEVDQQVHREAKYGWEKTKVESRMALARKSSKSEPWTVNWAIENPI